MKYEVSVDLIDYYNATIIVEADSEEEAIEKAYDMDLNDENFERYDAKRDVLLLGIKEDDDE